MSARLLRFPWNLVGLFLTVRLMQLMALPIEGLRGYGDIIHFYRLAALGRPFLDYWVEFPPVFPFLINILFSISNGVQHVFDYLLVSVLTIIQAGNILLFAKLALKVLDETRAKRLTWFYLLFLTGLFYGWWYFDPLAVSTILCGTYLLMSHEDDKAGMAVAVGALTKWFPVLTLGVAWRFRPPRRALRTTLIALGIILMVLAGLYLLSPDLTSASLLSQTNKGSWETIWALLDGNLITGNFGPEWQRSDPAKAVQPLGNPPKLSPWLTILPFLVAGLYLSLRVKRRDERTAISFLGLTLCLFFLWSPGWSPQWILYLIPIALLAMDFRRAIIFCFNLVFVSLLEWPILLSRGRFDLLWAPVILRTFILLFMGIEFGRLALRSEEHQVRGGVE